MSRDKYAVSILGVLRFRAEGRVEVVLQQLIDWLGGDLYSAKFYRVFLDQLGEQAGAEYEQIANDFRALAQNQALWQRNDLLKYVGEYLLSRAFRRGAWRGTRPDQRIEDLRTILVLLDFVRKLTVEELADLEAAAAAEQVD